MSLVSFEGYSRLPEPWKVQGDFPKAIYTVFIMFTYLYVSKVTVKEAEMYTRAMLKFHPGGEVP